MTLLPANLALTNIAPNAAILSADHRTNYSAIQAYANAMNALLAGGAAGDVLGGVGTTMTFAKPPGYEYAYNEFTANVSVTATTEATANTLITASAVTFDGATPVWIEFFCPLVRHNTLAAAITPVLYDGAAAVSGNYGQFDSVVANQGQPWVFKRRVTPSAAAHTYSWRAFTSAGTGTVFANTGGAGVAVAGFIRITKA